MQTSICREENWVARSHSGWVSCGRGGKVTWNRHGPGGHTSHCSQGRQGLSTAVPIPISQMRQLKARYARLHAQGHTESWVSCGTLIKMYISIPFKLTASPSTVYCVLSLLPCAPLDRCDSYLGTKHGASVGPSSLWKKPRVINHSKETAIS